MVTPYLNSIFWKCCEYKSCVSIFVWWMNLKGQKPEDKSRLTTPCMRYRVAQSATFDKWLAEQKPLEIDISDSNLITIWASFFAWVAYKLLSIRAALWKFARSSDFLTIFFAIVLSIVLIPIREAFWALLCDIQLLIEDEGLEMAQWRRDNNRKFQLDTWKNGKNNILEIHSFNKRITIALTLTLHICYSGQLTNIWGIQVMHSIRKIKKETFRIN